jgi:hypothetical protein
MVPRAVARREPWRGFRLVYEIALTFRYRQSSSTQDQQPWLDALAELEPRRAA